MVFARLSGSITANAVKRQIDWASRQAEAHGRNGREMMQSIFASCSIGRFLFKTGAWSHSSSFSRTVVGAAWFLQNSICDMAVEFAIFF
jgi:hypothetical protein